MELNKISVVIVTFRRPAQLRDLLTTLTGPAPAGLQVTVVDNGSRDATTTLDDEFPEVRFNHLQRNFGLTRALNIGTRASDGEYVLLLHDDVRITAESVSALADFLESREDVGAVCPNLNRPQVRPLPTPANPDPQFTTPAPAAEMQVECVSGAAIMVRSVFLRSLGHIDERYGNYGSEIEICHKIKSNGRKLLILQNVPAEHNSVPSVVPATYLEGDRIAGTAAYLTKHHGAAAGIAYRMKSGAKALFTFRFRALAAAKIDGWG